jgi:Mpv17 / PMP22 family
MPSRSKSGWAIATKIAIDRFFFTPLNLSLLYAWITSLEQGCRWSLIQKTVSNKLWHTWLVSNAIWPLAHYFNFRFVATEHRVLFVNCVSVLWNILLCRMVEGDGRQNGNLRKGRRQPDVVMEQHNVKFVPGNKRTFGGKKDHII